MTHVEDRLLEKRVLLCPVEESIWSKSFVMDRERFDGADIAHLLRAQAAQMNWSALQLSLQARWSTYLTW